MNFDRISSIFFGEISASKINSNLAQNKYKLSVGVVKDTNLIIEVE